MLGTRQLRVWIVALAVNVVFGSTPQCSSKIDSADPIHGPIRAGNDISCKSQPDSDINTCIQACCGNAKCEAFTFNSPWTLGNGAYMDCIQGLACCCQKSAVPPLEPNKWAMNVTSGVITRSIACVDDESCSLNGVCQPNGTCQCDTEWTGSACEMLNLVSPSAVNPVYPPPELYANTTSWGGSVVKDPKDGSFHMFLAEMENSCGMNTWSTNSIIRHATADTPLGPFQRQEIIMQAFAHNPTALQAPDGTFLIYHIGCGTPNPGGTVCTDCKAGVTGSSCHGPGEQVACNDNTTNILYSKSLNGPWQQLNAPFIKSATMGTPYQIDNPTVTFFPNGSLLMLGRGGNLHSEGGSDGVITAPSWRGPYTMHTVVGAAGSPAVEDPFVWQDHRGNFHALFHKFTDEHPGCGGHAFSRDGFDWTLPTANAYTTMISTSDGHNTTFFRRERPHLLFDDSGTRPVALFTSLTNWGQSGGDKAFTFGQLIVSST
eukprot:m.260567 g.260567  ORF g.260567 m.260567 type:complete len:488 (-) comp40130_c0_seq1:87-1550(-)